MATSPFISGDTRLYGSVGHPITQVGAPRLFTERFQAMEYNAVLVPLHVEPESFDDAMRGLLRLGNLDGIIVTIPYKSRVLPFVDRVESAGRLVGAINALRRELDGTWTGDMFDGTGLVRGLAAQGQSVAGARVMQLGAGGAGGAIAFALAHAGAHAITLFDPDEARAQDVAARAHTAYPTCDVRIGTPTVDGCDVLVNATPIGMSDDDGLPWAFGPFNPRLVVADVVVKAEPTPLVRHAQSHGCVAMSGQSMLQGQADSIMEFFGLPR